MLASRRDRSKARRALAAPPAVQYARPVSENRRQSYRVRTSLAPDLGASLFVPSGPRAPAQLVDVSFDGCCIEVDTSAVEAIVEARASDNILHSVIEVGIEFTGQAVRVRAEIRWSAPRRRRWRLGLLFSEMTPDDKAFLRKMVMELQRRELKRGLPG